MKRIVWEGSSRRDVRTFPSEARADIGYQLYRVQLGLEPSDFKSMSSVAHNVREIRIHAGNEYRVLYIAGFKEAIYVLHVLDKKTQKTPKQDIELAKKRFGELIHRSKSA